MSASSTELDTRPTGGLYAFSPDHSFHDDGVDVCFYSARRTSGSTLRGLAAQMARALFDLSGPSGRFSLDAVGSASLHIEPDRWTRLVEELVRRGIVLRSPEGQGLAPVRNAPITCVDTPLGRRTATALADVGSPCRLVDARDLADALHEQVGLVILADERYDVPLHHTVNTAAVSHGSSALYLRVGPSWIELGPLAVPGLGPCFECYWQRLQAPNLADGPAPWVAGQDFAMFRDESAAARSVRRIALELLVLEATRASVDGEQVPVTLGRVVRFEPHTMQTRHLRVLEVPGCGACALAPGEEASQ